jgi:RNA polymerase-binding transcription factor DksA
MASGLGAGRGALGMLGASSERELKQVCARHEKEWAERLGKRHRKLAKVKGALARIPDSDYNKAARTLAAIPPARLTMSRIFTVSLGRSPRLVWAMRHLM